MSLQTRTAAPGKARRAAKGKPRHTSAQKAAKKAAPAKKSTFKAAPAKSSAPARKSAPAKSATTKRYSDRETVTKKEVRLADRSKLRAQRFQERTASKSKNIEGAPKGNPKQSREERSFAKPPRKAPSRAAKFVAERTERAERPFKADRPFRPERLERPAKSDVRPTTRREAV